MKQLNPRTFVIFGVAALLGVILLHTSQSVQNAEDRLASLRTDIAREEEKILMLQAEWAHLNRPERLEQLAQEFLDLVPPSPERLMRNNAQLFEDLPEHEDDPAISAQPVSISPPIPKPAPPKIEEKAKDFDALIDGLSNEGEEGTP